MSSYQEQTKDLVGKKIFITGATGFVGYRLAEILVSQYNAQVSVLIRDYGRAYRLGRLPVQIIKGDLTNKEDIERAIGEADYVFHCAYGNKGTSSHRESVNIEGTEFLLGAALSKKVKAFVFVSTVSVYGVQEVSLLTEKISKIKTNHSYGKSKLLAEEKVLGYYRDKGLNTVVIQPTAVYGPYAPSYGIRIFDQMKTHLIPLLKGGQGICNAVYIDDLIQALLLAATTPKAYGEAYLINGADYCTWEEFYGYFEQIVGEKTTVEVTESEMMAWAKKARKKPSVYVLLAGLIHINVPVAKELLQFKLFYYLFIVLKNVLPRGIYLRLKNGKNPSVVSSFSTESKKVSVLSEEDMKFYMSQTKVSIDKAISDLNYMPFFSFEKGFERVELWYKWFYNR